MLTTTQPFTTFSVTGSSVALMKPGEQGIVTRLRQLDRQLCQRLTEMGLLPGVSIRVEQRVPTFVIQAGQTRLTLDKRAAQAIYVRVSE